VSVAKKKIVKALQSHHVCREDGDAGGEFIVVRGGRGTSGYLRAGNSETLTPWCLTIADTASLRRIARAILAVIKAVPVPTKPKRRALKKR
jgi:hypothetical protein